MPNGDSGGGFDFGSLFDSLVGELAAVVDAIIQFLHDLVVALVSALNTLFAGEQAIFGFSFAGLSDVWGGLKKILDHLLHDVILASLAKLYDFYKRILAWAKKLKAWLDRLQQIQKKLQTPAFRHFINLIQRIRKILLVFRLFHLKFAQKLDAWLAGIEGKLIQRQLEYQRKTNEIIGWINFIADPTSLLRVSPLAQSIYRYLRGLRGVLGIPESRLLTTKEQTTQQEDRDLLKKTPQLTDPAVQRILAGLDAAAQEFLS